MLGARFTSVLTRSKSSIPPICRAIASEVTSGKMEVEGTKLHWERHGHGKVPVLFHPGLAGSIQSNYGPVFKKMDPQVFTMVGIDPEGYGKSRPPNRNTFSEEFCLERDARLAGFIMNELGYEKYAVVGWSSGGLTAIMSAKLFPDAVTRVVMCNTPMWLSAHTNFVMDHIVNLKNWGQRHRKDLLRVYEKDYAVKLLRDWRQFIRMEVDKPKFIADVITQFKTMKPPLMFIYGTKDSFTTADDAWRAYDEHMTCMDRIHLVRNGTHFHLDFLDEFVYVTSEFLQEDPSGFKDKHSPVLSAFTQVY